MDTDMLEAELTEERRDPHEWVSEMRAQGAEAWEDVRELIQKHPVKAVGAALWLGGIMSVLYFGGRGRGA